MVVLIAMFAVGGYNSLVSARETVDTQLSNIDTQLQRRNDLIPNFVNTVKAMRAMRARCSARYRTRGQSCRRDDDGGPCCGGQRTFERAEQTVDGC